jgi:hypothetical protein
MLLMKYGHARGLPDSVLPVNNCKECIFGKHHRTPFRKNATCQTTEVLERVYSDISGPMEAESLGGRRYSTTFTDDKARCSKVYMLESKAFQMFKEYKTEIEKYTEKKINIL